MLTQDEMVAQLLEDNAKLLERLERLEQRSTVYDHAAEDSDPQQHQAEHSDLEDLDPAEARQAREARARLAADVDADAGLTVTAAPAVELIATADGTVATFPTPSRQQVDDRRRALEFLDVSGLQGLTHEQACHAYVQGGALWLHAYDREWVLQQPLEVKRLLIADAQATGFTAAHDLGKDILKVRDAGGVDW